MARALTQPNAENASIHELLETARAGSLETAKRCTAIQMLIVGCGRAQVCAALLVTERAVQKWVRAFNERGIDGLIVRERSGRPRKLAGAQAESLATLLDRPEEADRTFWTARAFHGHIRQEYRIDCSYETVVRFFHEQNFALKVPQPWPDRQDEQQRQAFRELLRALCADAGLDLWFSDESGFLGDPRPRQRWDKRGRKTRVVKNGDHVRMNAIGMVCPRTGEFFAIETSHVDTEMFQAFLDEADRQVDRPRTRNILVLDNASWHKRASLDFHGFEPLFLPPYSPDLNPIERLWLVLKAKWFNHHVCRNRDALIERLDQALLDLIGNPEQVQSVASIRT
jgi:transposase